MRLDRFLSVSVSYEASVPPIRVQLQAHLSIVIAVLSLFGVITVQTFSYFQYFPRDKVWLKCVVRHVLRHHSLLAADSDACGCPLAYFRDRSTGHSGRRIVVS